MNSLVRFGAATLVAAAAVGGISGSAWAGKAKATSFNYSLAPGTCTGAETVPVASLPVQVIGSQISGGYRGVSEMSLIAVPSAFLEWIGIDFKTGGVTKGFSSTAGTHMLYLDYTGGLVDVQVASDTQIMVCNSPTTTSTATGTVTFIY